jgi:hypothetical protein
VPEDELLEALRGLGADHEPDVAAIRRRMEDERPTVVPLRRRIESGPRRRPVLLSAAAAILIGGGVTVAASQLGPNDNGTPANDLPVVVPTLQTPTPEATRESPSPSVTSPDARRSKEPTPDGVATSRQGENKTPTPERTTQEAQPPSSGSAERASTSVSELSVGQEISLGEADEDWLAIGTRNDMKTVRKKDAANSALLNFTAPESAASVDGPFRVSWQGGIPEQDRVGSTRWMQTNGAVVTVNASADTRTVTLYLGNAMNVVVKGEGLKPHKVTLGDQAMGYAVTVEIPSHAGDTTIELQSGRGPVHLAAATASSS